MINFIAPIIAIWHEFDIQKIAADADLPAPPVDDLHEIEIEVQITPGTPGNYFGLPENCYPAEPADPVCQVDEHELAAELLTFYAAQMWAAGRPLTDSQRAAFTTAALPYCRVAISDAENDALAMDADKE